MKQLFSILLLIAANNLFSQNDPNPSVGSLSGSSHPENLESREPVTNVSSSNTTIALLTKEIDESQVVYTFISNRPFDQILKERWEYRFPMTFPYIIDFNMDVATQKVTINLQLSHSEDELLNLVRRFQYSDYQLN